jgi:hypothetical protein
LLHAFILKERLVPGFVANTFFVAASSGYLLEILV